MGVLIYRPANSSGYCSDAGVRISGSQNLTYQQCACRRNAPEPSASLCDQQLDTLGSMPGRVEDSTTSGKVARLDPSAPERGVLTENPGVEQGYPNSRPVLTVQGWVPAKQPGAVHFGSESADQVPDIRARLCCSIIFQHCQFRRGYRRTIGVIKKNTPGRHDDDPDRQLDLSHTGCACLLLGDLKSFLQ